MQGVQAASAADGVSACACCSRLWELTAGVGGARTSLRCSSGTAQPSPGSRHSCVLQRHSREAGVQPQQAAALGLHTCSAVQGCPQSSPVQPRAQQAPWQRQSFIHALRDAACHAPAHAGSAPGMTRLAAADHKWGQAYLTREFFHMLGEAMPQHVVLATASEAGSDQLLAGAACLSCCWPCTACAGSLRSLQGCVCPPARRHVLRAERAREQLLSLPGVLREQLRGLAEPPSQTACVSRARRCPRNRGGGGGGGGCGFESHPRPLVAEPGLACAQARSTCWARTRCLGATGAARRTAG